jgi:MFS family permease
VLLGVGYSVTAALTPAMVSDRFSGPHFGAIVGIGLMGAAVGSALGPWIAGTLYDATGSYTLAFMIAAGCGMAAGAAGWRARKLRIEKSGQRPKAYELPSAGKNQGSMRAGAPTRGRPGRTVADRALEIPWNPRAETASRPEPPP